MAEDERSGLVAAACLRSRPPNTLRPVICARLAAAPHPDVGGQERRRGVDPLVQNQICDRRSPSPASSPRRAAIARTSLRVHETVERGIGGPDSLLDENGSSFPAARYRALQSWDGIPAPRSTSSMRTERRSLSVALCVADYDAYRGASYTPPRSTRASYNCERGPRTRPSSS